MSSSVVMMTNVSADTTGDNIQADGYYGYADGLHTVAFYTTGYTGKIYIQGTLASTPVEADWFNVELVSGSAYLDLTTSTATTGYSFTGNYVYLRAKAVDRTAGTINKILLKI